MEKVMAAHKDVLSLCDHQAPADITAFDVHKDMTILSLSQLGQAYQYFGSLLASILQKLGEATSVLSALEFRRRGRKDQLVIALNAGRKKYTMDAEISQDPIYRELSELILVAEARKTALDMAAKGLETKTAILSREISRRGEERNR